MPVLGGLMRAQRQADLMNRRMEQDRIRAIEALRPEEPNPFGSYLGQMFGDIGAYTSGSSVSNSTSTVSPEESFQVLKKSVRDIEAETFESGARRRIEDKINRLQRAGAVAQASILEQEIRTRQALVRLKEWDYKLLTREAIDKFQSVNMMTSTRDGLKVHIEPLDKYCGNPQVGEAKDRIIPDHILDKLEEANERELFDSIAVLYVEKVPDPLLLGIVEGCEDYFLIAEWGEDVSFEQITKGE